MTKLTLGQAAKATGKGKSTIKNAIDKGRLSADRDDLGQYAIDPSELFRVYDPVSKEPSQSDSATPPKTPSNDTLDTAIQMVRLEEQIKGLQALLKQTEGERDNLKEQVNQRLIADGRSWWKRTFG